jgi:UDP-hydrolysing UDP-N-acetyl-D-glucosamine 2-epimerase
MTLRKILALSSIRSEYDLMSGLYRMLNSDSNIDFKILVSGAHLSRSYGLSVNHIKADGLIILAEIESLIDGDRSSSRLKTASIFLQCAIDIVSQWSPDLIIYAGDREDVLIGGMLGAYLRIPTVHFFGGDHELDGHVDTAARHATSKLSTAHVVSIDEHRRRLISMGESDSRICVSGSVALDKFIEDQNLVSNSVSSNLISDSLIGYALVIFHPVDDEMSNAGEIFERILLGLEMQKIPAWVSYPNTDPGNHSIIDVINRFGNRKEFKFYKNLPRVEFMSLFKNAKFLIGNSSSGIQEAASIPLGVVNVGNRQKGRRCGGNVIFCESDQSSINSAIEKVISKDFTSFVMEIDNIYGKGDACSRAYEFLMRTDFKKMQGKIEDPLTLSYL